MSRAQIRQLVRTATAEDLERHITALEVRFMSLVEWMQSNYPEIQLPDDYKRNSAASSARRRAKPSKRSPRE